MVSVWMVAVAAANGGPACDPVVAPSGDAAAVLVRIDGDLTIEAAVGDQVSVEACGAEPRVRRRGAAIEVTARRRPTGAVIVRLPATIASVTVHEHDGSVATTVPARLAIVSSRGPVEIRGASALRVAYHEGDIVVHDLAGDLTADHVSGQVSGTVRGEILTDTVSGGVQVTRTPTGSLTAG